MSLWVRRLALCLIAGTAAALCAGPAWAQSDNCGAELNYENADIRAVIDEIAIRTGRTFILDPAVQGRVTIKSPPNSKICPDEAWELFQAMLRVNGFVATPIAEGKFRIVPLQDGARSASGADDGTGSDLVTQIVRLRYVDAREAAANLAQIIGDSGVISPVRSSNAIVIVDTASNIGRLRRVLAELDRDTAVYRTIRLENASAVDVSRIIADLASDISEEQGGAQAKFSVTPVEASNSLLLRAEPALMKRLESVVAELDRYGEVASELSVISLKHANAEELAPLLAEVADTTGGAQGAGGQTRRASVSYHKPTNSIIIRADANTQRTLMTVIEKLDVRRPQVLVEAIIVDVSDGFARDLGVQYFLTGDKIPFTATNFSDAPNILPAAGAALLQGGRYTSAINAGFDASDPDAEASPSDLLTRDLAEAALTSLLGFQGIGVGGGFEFGDGNFFGGILTALQADTESNILSTPSVVTVNNKAARLQVGQEIPITTGEAVGDNFTNAFRTIDRKEIGVILEVTPQINDGDTVTLEITQEISSIAGTVTTSSQDLITNKREITTTALVDSGDILIIGGLIDEQRALEESKVPFLGDIPGVGNIFKTSGRSKSRQNLMVFIRPTIIRDQKTARAATDKKYDYIRARELLRSGGPKSNLDRLIEEATGVHSPSMNASSPKNSAPSADGSAAPDLKQ